MSRSAFPGEPSLTWPTIAGIAVLLSLGAVYLYVPTIGYSFIADDGVYLGVRNDRLLDLPLSGLYRLLWEPMNPWEFLPVRDLTYWLDAFVFGKYPDGYHFSNLLWYFLTCGALYWTLGRLLALVEPAPDARARNVALALLGVAVFAYHPAHIEPVAWISGRKDLLAGLFSILAWGSLLHAIQRSGAARWLLISLTLFVLACFAKSVAVAVGGIMFFTASAYCRDSLTTRAIRVRLLVFSLAVMILAACSLAVHVAVGRELGIQIPNNPGYLAQTERASRILSLSVRLLFVPDDRRLLHDIYEIGAWHWALTTLSVGLLALAIGETVWRARVSLWAMGVLWCLLPLFSYLQWVPFSTWSMASDRFVFLSSVGYSILVLAAFRHASQVLSLALVSCLVVAGAGVIIGRLPDWRDEKTLIDAQAAASPRNFVSARLVAVRYAIEGDKERALATIDGVERQDAREVLAATVDLLLNERANNLSGTLSVSAYCHGRMSVVRLVNKEFDKIGAERDLTYSNFLRNLRQQLNLGGRLDRLCAGFHGARAKLPSPTSEGANA